MGRVGDDDGRVGPVCRKKWRNGMPEGWKKNASTFVFHLLEYEEHEGKH
jgi:hypothetical protein